MIAQVKGAKMQWKVAARSVVVMGRRTKVMAVDAKPRGRKLNWSQVYLSGDFVKCLGWIMAQVMAGK